jgi:hypothetical protein
MTDTYDLITFKGHGGQTSDVSECPSDVTRNAKDAYKNLKRGGHGMGGDIMAKEN